MATPEVLDFAKLLAPIPGGSPAGPNLREDSSPTAIYHELRDARKAASDAERRIDKGDEGGEPPDWKPVLDRSSRALAEKSKDMEVAAYLIEALVRLKGFAGLRDGYRLARELVALYWAGLNPPAEGGGDAPAGEDGAVPAEGDGAVPVDGAPVDPATIEARFSHMLYLNGIDGPGTLIVPVRKIPLTIATGEGTFNLTHRQQADGLAKISDPKVRQKRIDSGAITPETIQKAVAATPAKFYVDLLDDAAKAVEEIKAFGKAMLEKSGYDPPSSDLLGAIEAYVDAVKDVARDKLPRAQPAAPAADPNAAPAAGPDGAAAPAPPADPALIRSREDALERIAKVGDYFRKHEPQSIIPYALDQIIHWGKLSLPELLAELIPEEAPRKSLFKQVGIRPPDAKK